ARLALFIGIDRVGVARTASLGATAPLVAVVLAIVFLGERPSWRLLVGAAVVVGGGGVLATRAAGRRARRRRGLVYPGPAAFGFGVRDNLSRYGFREFADPMLAAAVASTTSVGVVWSYALVAARERLRWELSGVKFVVCAGLAEGLAYATMWRALSTGSV